MIASPVHAKLFCWLHLVKVLCMHACSNAVSSYMQCTVMSCKCLLKTSSTPGSYNLSALSMMTFDLWGKGAIQMSYLELSTPGRMYSKLPTVNYLILLYDCWSYQLQLESVWWFLGFVLFFFIISPVHSTCHVYVNRVVHYHHLIA